MISLPDDARAVCLRFLPYPEATARVHRSFGDSIPLALTDWTLPCSSSFLNEVRRRLDEKLGFPLDSIRRGFLIRQVAVETIQKAAFFLSDAEWQEAGFDPNRFSGWDFDTMSRLIRGRRSDNLVSFFTRMARDIPAVSEFLNLHSHIEDTNEKARLIRIWLEENPNALNEIEFISRDILENMDNLPVEILNFKNLSAQTLINILRVSSKSGNAEVVNALVADPRFAQISSNYILGAFYDAAEAGQNQIASKIANTAEFREAPIEDLGELLSTAVDANAEGAVQAILNCPRNQEIPLRYLENALRDNPNLPNFKALLKAPQSQNFSAEFMKTLLDDAYAKRSRLLVRSITECRAFEQLSRKARNKAYHFLERR